MKDKHKFTLVLLVYYMAGIMGYLKFSLYAYLEQDSWQKVMRDNFSLLLAAAVVATVLILKAHKKWMPEKYEKRKDKLWYKLFVPVVYIALCFFINTGIVYHEDLFFSDKAELRINGEVINKDWRRASKGGRTYYLSVSDSVTTLNYYFRVKKRIYEQYKRGEHFDKVFHRSKLGILYRKED